MICRRTSFRTTSVCTTFLLSTFWLTAASGDVVIYDNGAGGAAGIDNAFLSDIDGTSSGIVEDLVLADDVTLAATRVVTGIEWTGFYSFDDSPPALDGFFIEIYSDAVSGGPGSLLHVEAVFNDVNRVDSTTDIPDFPNSDIYNYSADINFTMTAGTTYWVSISNDTTLDTDDDWFWGALQSQGNNYASTDFGLTWQENFLDGTGNRLDFRLTGVPEPGATTIGCLAVMALALRRRRV